MNIELTNQNDNDTQLIKYFNLELNEEQHTRLKIYAASQSKTMREILINFIESLPKTSVKDNSDL